MRLSRPVGLAVTLLVLALGLVGCGGDDDDPEAKPDKPSAAIIEIIEDGGTITPDDGHVVEVKVGQEIKLNVSSDVDDEIHVHSEPEHEFEVTGGEDADFSFTIDVPGTYPIESHGLEVTLVKLQVS